MTKYGYAATFLTQGTLVEFEAVKDEWFKVGASMQNDTDTYITVYADVECV